MNSPHLTREDLLLHVDGMLSAEEQNRVEKHLGECPSCAHTADEMGRIGRAVRGLPVERTSAGFTASVLHDLGLVPSPRRRFQGLESAGALVAMVVVAGVLLSVFFATGVLRQEQVSDTQTAVGTALGAGGEAVARGVNSISNLAASYLSFAPGKGAMEISIAALVVLGLLAAVDWFAGRKLQHRTSK